MNKYCIYHEHDNKNTAHNEIVKQYVILLYSSSNPSIRDVGLN